MADQAVNGELPDWPSTLDSVVVHASGAVCRRLARVALPGEAAGPVRLRLIGLPRTLDPASLRATVTGDGDGWRVTEVRPAAQAQLRAPEQLPETRRLLAEALEREAALRERRTLLAARITETAALRAVPPAKRRDDPHRRSPADAVLALADFVDDRLTALQAREEQLRGGVPAGRARGAPADRGAGARFRRGARRPGGDLRRRAADAHPGRAGVGRGADRRAGVPGTGRALGPRLSADAPSE